MISNTSASSPGPDAPPRSSERSSSSACARISAFSCFESPPAFHPRSNFATG
jgi:hypothetical protein